MQTADAQDVYQDIAVSVPKVFERMLKSSQKEDYIKIQNTFFLLEPLFSHIGQSFDIDIKGEINQAIKEKNRNKVINRTQQLVCLSIYLLFMQADQYADNRKIMASRIKEAFSEYLVLDYFIQNIDFNLSRNMKQTFRHANMSVGVRPQEFKKDCRKIQRNLNRMFFPEL